MTATRLQTVFASLDPPQAWPPTRGRPQPQRLELGLDALPGVGVTLKRKLAKLGLETVRDLLDEGWNRPYTRSVGCLPAGGDGADKYWPPVGRVDNVHGDRNLQCSCPPIAEMT